MTAACIGTFVMAESGLLDRQRATTTWWLAPLFRERYPRVVLEESQMIVRSGRLRDGGRGAGPHRPGALADPADAARNSRRSPQST